MDAEGAKEPAAALEVTNMAGPAADLATPATRDAEQAQIRQKLAKFQGPLDEWTQKAQVKAAQGQYSMDVDTAAALEEGTQKAGRAPGLAAPASPDEAGPVQGLLGEETAAPETPDAGGHGPGVMNA